MIGHIFCFSWGEIFRDGLYKYLLISCTVYNISITYSAKILQTV